jgi:chemotaxis protein MotB
MSSRRKRRGHEAEEHENHERWMVTYADMVTLLMVLFIVLFAMSQVDQRKFHELKQGFQQEYGTGPTLLDGGSGLADGAAAGLEDTGVASDGFEIDLASAQKALEEKEEAAQAQARDRRALEEAKKRILAELEARGLQDAVRFRLDERGLVVTIVTDKVVFDLGQADLKPGGQTVLEAIAPVLRELPNAVTVEGHTDNLPISGGRYPSNWELSTARATTVLRYLLGTHAVPAGRLSAAGYGDQRPIVPNDTETNRSVNRRVAVVVHALNPGQSGGEATG